MKDKKQKIADFIESVGRGDISSSTILLGGAQKNPDNSLSENSGNCVNGNYESCNSATNRGDCYNTLNYCNKSKNGGACNNAGEATKPTNMRVDICG